MEWIERHKITSLYRRHAPLTHDGPFDSSGDREDHAVKVIVDRATGRDLSISQSFIISSRSSTILPGCVSCSCDDALNISESTYFTNNLH